MKAFRFFGSCFVAATSSLGSVQCCLDLLPDGSGTHSDETPATNEAAQNTFHENDFAADPTKAARLDQMIMLEVTPDASNGPNTGSPSVDEIPYEFTHATTLRLRVSLESAFSDRMELYDANGVLRLMADSAGATPAQLLEPGRYLLRIIQGANAPGGMRILRPRSSAAAAAASAGDPGPFRSPLDPSQCLFEQCWCAQNGYAMLMMDELELNSDVSCFEVVGFKFSSLAYGHWLYTLHLGGTQYATFRDCDFHNVHFHGTISNSQFINCQFNNVDWEHFELSNSRLTGCDFRFDDRNGDTIDDPAYWSPEIIAGLVLKDSTLENCNFAGCRFTDDPERRVTFRGSTIRNCNFKGTDFANVLLDEVKVGFASNTFDAATQFAGASMKNMDLTDVTRPASLSPDWRGVDLSGTRWSPGSNMAGADFTGCKFVNAVLASVLFSNNKQFAGADFTDADLRSAQFAGAALDGARLCNARLYPLDPAQADQTQTGASSADFTGASLMGADLSNADLRSVQFVAAKLDAARLYRAKLSIFDPAMTDKTRTTALGANFIGASLIGADLAGVDAKAANFENAILDKINATDTETPANLTFANLKNARLAAAVLGAPSDSGRLPANLSYAYMPNAQLTNGADCRRVQFSYARLYGWLANAQSANLAYADFDHAIVSGMDFSGAGLEAASFTNAQAVGCRFVGASLTNARFSGAYLLGADFTGAVLAGANFTNAAMSTGPCDSTTACSMCTSSSCKFADLNPASLCCYSISEQNGFVYPILFGATVLPNITGFTCPNASPSPCTDIKLIPMDAGPYPPAPACVPSFDTWCE